MRRDSFERCLADIGKLPTLPTSIMFVSNRLNHTLLTQSLDQAAHLCWRGAGPFGKVVLHDAACGIDSIFFPEHPQQSKLRLA